MNKLREAPDPSFVNFIARCLEWDPLKRLSPEDGLSHEWITKGLPPNIVLHNPHNNPYQRVKENNSINTNRGRSKPSEASHASSIVHKDSALRQSENKARSSKPVESRNMRKSAV